MKLKLSILLFFFTFQLKAQRHTLTGVVVDEKSSPLMFATVALLDPSDSTLAFFGITNDVGHFEIKNVNDSKYILQCVYIGYQSFYKVLEVPLSSGDDLGAIAMKPTTLDLKEAEVSGERIPILIKKDTIEYDAAAFKTKPDAATKELLKKLPGVEVDRAGNIRAQGEDVKNVLVDGKEFFGSDPKVATKNLPADAIKKVQVYDKKSDEAELTGVEDGARNKTINLLLKDDKKSAWIGDVQAGVGTDSRYQASAKAYRFTKQTQFAFLGMLNNINQFGFSFRDYIDFNGGFRSLMDGGGTFRMSANDENSLPINFGQPVTGLITSGAGGLNYTYEKKKDNRFNVSYLGNGTDKNLQENTLTQNYLPENTFTQNENLDELNKNRAHRLNFLLRNKADSSQSIIINGSASLTQGNKQNQLLSESYSEGLLLNQLNSRTTNDANGISTNAHASYLKRGAGNWKLFKITGDFSNSHSLTNSEWANLTRYVGTNESFTDNQFQDNQNDVLKYSAGTSITRKTGEQFYVEPEVKAGISQETLDREQGIPSDNPIPVDSLSPYIKNQYQWIRPGMTLKRSNEKSQFSVSALVETGETMNSYVEHARIDHHVFYFIPQLSWNLEYKKSRRVGIDYQSSVNTPTANQLLPVANTMNPLEHTTGNQQLRPEYFHSFQAHWMLFDQFSFTSIFAGLRGTYVHDKINLSQTINEENLVNSITLINVKNHYQGEANVEFSTPIRKVGLNFHANVSEKWSRGINFVNDIENRNENRVHEFTLSVDNRKKDKWTIETGGTLQLSTAKYSVQQSLNAKYANVNFFTEINFQPNDRWYYSVTADLNRYQEKAFVESIYVPLLKASITRYFLKSNRGVLTLEGFDLLDKNSGVERIGDLNYLRQKQSNIISRYFMITLKYRLNKFDSGDKIDVKIK